MDAQVAGDVRYGLAGSEDESLAPLPIRRATATKESPSKSTRRSTTANLCETGY